MKLVVITGCLGFIGMHVTRACLERGWRVYGIDKRTYAANGIEDLSDLCEGVDLSKFTFVEGDICELKDIPSCDYIINIAAETHVGNSIIDSTDFIHSNVTGVKNLLDIIRRKPSNVTRKPIFFHFSTDEVYGDIVEGSHTETSPLSPSNPYSSSKAAYKGLGTNIWNRLFNLAPYQQLSHLSISRKANSSSC